MSAAAPFASEKLETPSTYEADEQSAAILKRVIAMNSPGPEGNSWCGSRGEALGLCFGLSWKSLSKRTNSGYQTVSWALTGISGCSGPSGVLLCKERFSEAGYPWTISLSSILYRVEVHPPKPLAKSILILARFADCASDLLRSPPSWRRQQTRSSCIGISCSKHTTRAWLEYPETSRSAFSVCYDSSQTAISAETFRQASPFAVSCSRQ